MGVASDWQRTTEKVLGSVIVVGASAFIFHYARLAGSMLISAAPSTILAGAVTLLVLIGILPLRHVGMLAQIAFAAVGVLFSAAGFALTEFGEHKSEHEAQVAAMLFIVTILGVFLQIAHGWISPSPTPTQPSIRIAPWQWLYELLHFFRTGRGRQQCSLPPELEWTDEELKRRFGVALMMIFRDLMDVTCHKKQADHSYFYISPEASKLSKATREVLECWSVYYGPVERISDFYRINVAYQRAIMDFAVRCHRLAGIRIVTDHAQGE